MEKFIFLKISFSGKEKSKFQFSPVHSLSRKGTKALHCMASHPLSYGASLPGAVSMGYLQTASKAWVLLTSRSYRQQRTWKNLPLWEQPQDQTDFFPSFLASLIKDLRLYFSRTSTPFLQWTVFLKTHKLGILLPRFANELVWCHVLLRGGGI